MGKFEGGGRGSPYGKELNAEKVVGSVRAIHPEPGDLLVFRVVQKYVPDVEEFCARIGRALDVLDLRSKVTVLVLDSETTLDQIPYATACQILSSLKGKFQS